VSGVKSWRLQSKLERRFKAGHPWVYSNELQGSPKGVEPGEPIVLQDAGGAFLAYGYGNPHSLIAFRAVGRDEAEGEATAPAGVARRLARAWRARDALGFENSSCRIAFGEADDLPGLIVDRYVSPERKAVLVVQGQTAGADRWTRQWDEILKLWGVRVDAVVIRNDSSARKWEGLELEAPRVLADQLGEKTLRDFTLRVKPGVDFSVDLIEGQKTGFFFDQWANTQQFMALMEPSLRQSGAPVRILDLCCYVGQWSSQLVSMLARAGVRSEVVLVDASEDAISRAERNVRRAGGSSLVSVQRVRGNVLKDLGELPAEGFDVVISDPPALIKSRKDIPTGTHAYLQLHTQAIRLAKGGGWIAACSCSGLLAEESFAETLAKAARRNGLRGGDLQWVARGGQSPDHPVLAEFAEGRYLKAWLGRVSK
jgi:23S rRNA (cytosine1962-C5)-methyltransferase